MSARCQRCGFFEEPEALADGVCSFCWSRSAGRPRCRKSRRSDGLPKSVLSQDDAEMMAASSRGRAYACGTHWHVTSDQRRKVKEAY